GSAARWSGGPAWTAGAAGRGPRPSRASARRAPCRRGVPETVRREWRGQPVWPPCGSPPSASYHGSGAVRRQRRPPPPWCTPGATRSGPCSLRPRSLPGPHAWRCSWGKLSGVLLQERQPVDQHPHPLTRRLHPPPQRLVFELEFNDSLPCLDEFRTYQHTAARLQLLHIALSLERSPAPGRELLTNVLEEFGKLVQRTSVRPFVEI